MCFSKTQMILVTISLAKSLFDWVICWKDEAKEERKYGMIGTKGIKLKDKTTTTITTTKIYIYL